MNTRLRAAALACAAAVLAACGPTATDTESGASAAPAGKGGPTETGTVPDLVGMGLQSAQNAAQEAGFFALRSHDSTGRDRLQVFDRNWKVCSQSTPKGRSVPVGTTLDLGAVKLKEVCPAADVKAPGAADGRMPDVVGTSVKAARAALDPATSISVTDAAEDRMVLMESNWRVCSQSPAPGAALKGRPVEFTAVKFEEDC